MADWQKLGAKAFLADGKIDEAEAKILQKELYADGVIDDGSDSVVWEWDRPDFESVNVETGTSAADGDPVRAYEREVVRAVSASAEVFPENTVEARAAVERTRT